jgi:glutathione S-transferase
MIPTIPTITAFAQSPDRGQGLARDMPVRWALEEVGQPYDVRLVSFSALKEATHRALQPFGQIPTYEAGELALFESGAIVFHLAERHHVDVCGAQHGGATDRSARKRHVLGRRPDLV